jgi:hypothetical protein
MIPNYDVSFRHPAFKVKLLLAVTFLMLGTVMTLFMASPVRAASATLTVTTKEVNLGDTFAISGTGFSAGEKIAIWVTSPAGKAFDSAYLNADNLGNFDQFKNKDYSIVSGVGTWHVTVKGLTSGLTASDTFQVLAPTVKAAAILLGPLVVVAFSGERWEYGERVQLWITDPKTGAVYGETNISYAWATTGGDIPASPGLILFFEGTAGTYNLTVYGTTSGVTEVVPVVAS